MSDAKKTRVEQVTRHALMIVTSFPIKAEPNRAMYEWPNGDYLKRDDAIAANRLDIEEARREEREAMLDEIDSLLTVAGNNAGFYSMPALKVVAHHMRSWSDARAKKDGGI